MTELEQLSNSLLVAFVVLLLLCVTLIIWATVLLFQVQSALDRLHRVLNPRVLRDADGRKIRERI